MVNFKKLLIGKAGGIFLSLLVIISMFFTTCDSPMGMGPPIDWDPPVLTLDPKPPNPMYVRQGAVLVGTVTDNVAVDRVILRDAATGEEMFRATLTGDRWEIALEFTEDQNGKKIMAEVVAFDRRGNSGDSSIRAITLIVDIGPPLIEDIWIQRTVTERAYLETYYDTKNLEVTDPNGENSANLNRYQNGYFTIAGKIREDETRIDIVSLNIYDTEYPDTELLSIPLAENISTFNPSWLVKEEDILAAGDSKIDPDYSGNYYNGNARYYYRVTLIAIDRSENESRTVVEDEGYFCMWQKADEPKGILDPVMAGVLGSAANPVVVTGGSTLPVEFFDDDQLLWAYTGLLTLEQWNAKLTDPNGNPAGDAYIHQGVTIPQFPSDPDANYKKLEFLRNRIVRDGQDVFNWKFYKAGFPSTFVPDTKDTIGNEVAGQSINSKIIYVQTGSDPTDNGGYVLFTLTADTKLSPHTNGGPQDTNKPRETYRMWYVNVIDENEPLIVFDTVITSGGSYVPSVHPGSSINEKKGDAYITGNSPEDNTFPDLKDGQYFEINGYTLRAKKTENDKVRKFRMAWIPSGIGTGDDAADSYISRVQTALSALDYPASFARLGLPPIIQHWDFVVTDDAANHDTYENGKLLTGTDQKMDEDSEDKFAKQVFRKRFDVLGGPDDLKPSYYNFRTVPPNQDNPLENLENDIKLFVFYAEDSMGHIVYRQLRLLGNKKPPNLTVYDITDRILGFDYGPSDGLPNLTNKTPPTDSTDKKNYYFYNGSTIDEEGRGRYYTTLQNYQTAAYGIMQTSISGEDVRDDNKTEAYTPYPLDTVLKYWVKASESGDLDVEEIRMYDITSIAGRRQVGHFVGGTTNALSYVEMLPEVTMRVFLFEASDTLGNTAQIQRTVAITNAARLENITTSTQTGTYGIGTKITIKANYSNLVRWTGTAKPRLNVRYYENGSINNSGDLSSGNQVIRQIETITAANTPSLSLDFEFTVGENFTGVLETMYIDIGGPVGTGTGLQGSDTAQTDRPIYLPTGTKVLDASREDEAFTPGYSQGYSWSFAGGANTRALQYGKAITLDGIRPRITDFKFDPPTGKTPYTDTNPGYYLKSDDTIQFTLTANKDIFTSTSGSPVIQFQVGTTTTYRSAAWQRADGDKGMVFSVIVNTANTPDDGSVSNIRLADVSGIVDAQGNTFSATAGAYSPAIMAVSTGNGTIRVDKTPPVAPTTYLGGAAQSDIIPLSAIPMFNSYPTFSISIFAANELGIARTEYSTNNGVSWDPYTPGGQPLGALENKKYTLVTRFVDRAGNLGNTVSQEFEMNTVFPRLIAVTPVQANGWHRTGNLQFDLNFENEVRIPTSGAEVSITLRNRSTANNSDAETAASTAIARITAPTGGTTYSSTVRVSFDVATKEMKDGLYVNAVNFAALRDRFGNVGGTWSGNWAGTDINVTTPNISPNSSTCSNLRAGLRVDAVAPEFRSSGSNPTNGGESIYPTTTNDRRNRIVLNFSENIQKGSGTITIQPRTNFLVPPVFEDTGYYLNYDLDASGNEVRSSTSSNITTWVAGLYDIYNSLPNDATGYGHKNALTASTTVASQSIIPTNTSYATVPSSATATGVGNVDAPSMTRLQLNPRTGQPVGPYVKTTHGLKSGYGYSGNYTGNFAAAEVQGPNTESGYNNSTHPLFEAMIPDTSVKWVLRYNLAINSNDSAITGIRNALRAAKFRWQEIDVAWSQVEVNGSNVTITLTEPLLKGLEWTVSYTAGTFTDEAGNNAAALNVDSYTFWSQGTQKPVIRVDRKSYDARTANWHRPRNATNNSSSFEYAEETTGEWRIAAFNEIAYRIETETPGATINYAVTTRTNSITAAGGGGTFNSVIIPESTGNLGASDTNGIGGTIWTGTITGGAGYTDTTWQATPAAATNNDDRRTFWVRPNLLRKFGISGGYGDRSAQIVNGDQRRSSGSLAVLHSYNADATPAALSGMTLGSTATGSYTGSFTYDRLEAGKNYVVATATRATQAPSVRGYEGVFRTLVVLNGQRGNRSYTGTQSGGGANSGINKILVGGSNIKAGTPSIPGFPLLEGAETGDARFVKMMYNVDHHDNNHTATNGGVRFYWVSTEIVSEFYMVYFGNGGNTQRTGDVNNYLMVRYGDLSYAFRLDRFPD